MILRDLPSDEQEYFRRVMEEAGQSWEVIQGLTLEEYKVWGGALLDDLKAKLECKRKEIAVLQELEGLVRSVTEQYPELPLWKAKYFLHGEPRARFQALLRERRTYVW